ncbi:helix-turn-helix domain-containing protein [Micromonospora sp. ALFpr18c]|nr:winged helix-turn-helix domain-containing protein [Micromonospora sp. ALFpr18c]KAB1927200.1 helix-turn-helix domain-containing protein [Micromonospora sp. ALFpr18c]
MRRPGRRGSRRPFPQAQEDLRRRAVAAVKAGHTQAAVATVLGVSPQAVSRWVNAFDRKGNKALKAGKRGRRPGEQKALDPRQEARVRRAVVSRYPDQVALPGLVWTRPQVRQLVRTWFGIGLSLVTIGKYLRSWGLSPQKPIRKAYERNPEAVARWLEAEYPAIERQAKKEKAVILCNVRDWLAERVEQIEMHFLPGYAPEPNPVELLNGDIKRHVAQANPANPTGLAAAAASHLRRRQNQPEAVKSLFGKPEVRYAAG